MSAGQEVELAHAAAMPAPQGGALPTPLEWTALERMATTLAESDLVPYRLKRKPGDIAVILLAAREYGIPPLMALSKLPVVNGTPAPMGELMVALILRAGHSITAGVTGHGSDPITKATAGVCTARRREWPPERADEVLEFTIAEAIDAGLVDELVDGKTRARVTKTKNGQTVEERTPWEQYPRNMLRWRAVANLARLTFPDVLLGLSYLPEELGAMVDAEGQVITGELDEDDGPRGRRPAPPETLEARTARETIERALREDDPVVIRQVADWAAANGIDVTPVELDDDAVTALALLGNATPPLGIALIAIIKRLEDGAGPVIAPAEGEDGKGGTTVVQGEAQDGPAEAASAPPSAEAPDPGADTPPEGEPTPAQRVAAMTPANRAELVANVARAALSDTTVDTLRNTLISAREYGLLEDDVTSVLSDDDRDTLDVRDERVTFGRLLMTVGPYVQRHGSAVRAPDLIGDAVRAPVDADAPTA